MIERREPSGGTSYTAGKAGANGLGQCVLWGSGGDDASSVL